jgi:hypothetical protein
VGFIDEPQLERLINRLPNGEYRDYLRLVSDEGRNPVRPEAEE